VCTGGKCYQLKVPTVMAVLALLQGGNRGVHVEGGGAHKLGYRNQNCEESRDVSCRMDRMYRQYGGRQESEGQPPLPDYGKKSHGQTK
jgi:hypothetical protein